jgi:hypothetical protein
VITVADWIETIAQAAAEAYPEDSEAPDVAVSYIVGDREGKPWYAAIVRYNDGRQRDAFVRAGSVGDALRELAKKWLGGETGSAKDRLRAMVGA